MTDYPTKPVSFKTYTLGHWVVHKQTQKLGRILSYWTRRDKGSGTKYQIQWYNPPRIDFHHTRELRSATAREVAGMEGALQ